MTYTRTPCDPLGQIPDSVKLEELDRQMTLLLRWCVFNNTLPSFREDVDMLCEPLSQEYKERWINSAARVVQTIEQGIDQLSKVNVSPMYITRS